MNTCDISDSVRIHDDVAACEECGSASRIGRGLCLNCLLNRCLGDNSGNAKTLYEALNEVDIPDADWRIGNYQILEEIGRGGMGVIYRARQRHSRRIVALKRILSYQADSQETLVRFRREAEAAASLDHPNILPIYEVSESDDGLPFFSMKFAAGGSLQDLARSLRDDPRRIVRLMAKVTRAVQHAHGQGILHRDIKPGNILLDGRGEPLVSDFGLAKWLDTSSDLTRTITIFGTPGYIAPEQAQGPAKNLTASADIYSIGAVLFDLFTGRPPFLGEHALAVIKQAADKPAPKLRALAPSTDRDLETICAKCLEREPGARYLTAGDLAEDLERWLEGRPIIARPVSPPVRIWRWSKRNPKLAGSVAACLLAIAAAAVWEVQSRHLAATVREEQLAAHSIAVLPFLNLDTTQPDQALTNAAAQALQGNLSRVGPASVVAVSRTEAWLAGTGDPQDIQEGNSTTKARAVLTGGERHVNGRLRLSMRLMNASTGDVLLTRVLDLPPNSSAAAELVRIAAPAFRPILDARDWSTIAPGARDPGMRNPSARDFILTGRQLMFRDTIEDYDRSIHCLEKAIQIERNSAIAHAYLSSTLGSRAYFAPDVQVLNRAEKEALEAIRLEGDLPEGHRSLAGVYYIRNDFVNALEEQLRAIELGGPEERVASVMGMTLSALGQPHRAVGWLDMANHWTSLPGRYDSQIGDCWTLLGEDQRAENAYRRSSELRPEATEGWVGLCRLRLLQGDVNAARKMCQENQERTKGSSNVNDNSPKISAQVEFFARNYVDAERLYHELVARDSSGGGGFLGGISYCSALGCLRQKLGDKSAGQTILRECLQKELTAGANSQNPETLYRIAAIYSSLEEKESAFEYLYAAAASGWIDYRSLHLDPRFDAIAADPRFQQIIATLTTKVAELRRQIGQPITMASTGETHSP
jgi:TolB-like protein/tetratricopeptide (TPR) repeat protein/tRNA A-37 threonylcarbamoyl transferase component Bud32